MGYYLGFDSSTQSLKAIIIDTEKAEITHSYDINFGKDLPEYKCPNGFLESTDPLQAHSDPMMWAAALDKCLSGLQAQEAPLDQVEGISGSGQQHGSVYLNKDFTSILKNLDQSKELVEQLPPALSRKTSPIWMDRSTSAECQELTDKFGAEHLQKTTGSPAIERFTGPQIRKFYKESPEAYGQTAIIHLVSSFMCSLLIGDNAPIDFGDGAGMNLLNLDSLQWDKAITEFTAPGLLDKLPPAIASGKVAGGLNEYFTKYGLKSGIPLIVWSGDNPNSLIGCGAYKPGTAVISLGTSDTFFGAMETFKTDPDGCGHVFGNPANGFMSLICFTNGSLAREKVKDICDVDWNYFDSESFTQTPPGNNGNLMLPYFAPESTPLVQEAKVYYKGSDEFCSSKPNKDELIRAVVESQMLSVKHHSAWMGDAFTSIRVTGGASKSQGLLQIIADIFQCDVETFAVSNSAGLGAAMRAVAGSSDLSFEQITNLFCKTNQVVKARQETKEIYDKLLEEFTAFEKEVK